MNIGFVVWNPFQVVQFAQVIKAFPGSSIVVVDKGDNLKLFDQKWLASFGARAVYVRQAHMPHIDGSFDVLFFQSPFPFMERLQHTRLVSLQYGLAKDRHNYGEWRALADMNLMYGPYSVERVSHFAPSFAVGNPKFEAWHGVDPEARRSRNQKKLGLLPQRQTLLYMPTWGDLGSFPDLREQLPQLAQQYNLIVKMHHNNDAGYPQWKKEAQRAGVRWIYDGSADQLPLLSVADLVISDFSGAIFDATYARVPVLLYQADADRKDGIQKFDLSSLEFARRDDIGLVCSALDQFPRAVEEALAQGPQLVARAEALRSELFVEAVGEDGSRCSQRIHARVMALLHGEVPPLTTSQRYVREAVQALRTSDRELRAMRRKTATVGRWLPFLR